MNLIRQLTVALILAAGFSAFCALIGSWTSEQVRHALRRNDPYQRLVIKGDGTPMVGTGRTFLEPDERPQLPGPDETWLDTAFLQAKDNRRSIGVFDDWHWRLRQFTGTRFPGIVWYFVTDAEPHGSAYFAGYDTKSKACIGYLGTAGLRAEPLPSEERFPFSGGERGSLTRLHSLNQIGWGQYAPIGVQAPLEPNTPWRVFVQGDDNIVYLVDLAERKVSVVYRDGLILSTTILLRSYPSADAGRRDLVVRGNDNIEVINGKTNERQRFVIPAELRDISFSWGQTTTGQGLAVWNDPLLTETNAFPHHLVRFDAAGNVLGRNDVDVPTTPSPNEERWMLGLNLPTPLYVDLYVGILRPYFLSGLRESFGAVVVHTAAEYWPSLLFVHVLSVFLAVLCYRRQKLNEASRAERIVWPVFVFLLGLPGWVGYRGTVPSRVSEFPTPELRGTEVFA